MNSKVVFTQGEWQIHYGDHSIAVITNDKNTEPIYYVAYPGEEQKANARLFKESPNMYAELRMIADCWEDIRRGKVRGVRLTPWQEERLGFIQKLLKEIEGN